MADCISVPLYINLHLGRSCIRYGGFRSSYSCFRAVQRSHSYGSSKIFHLSACKLLKFSALGVSNSKGIPCPGESALSCNCLGTLINSDGAAASAWVPIVDQILLTASMFLTFMAGVTPAAKSYFKPRMNVPYDCVVSGNPTSSGSMKNASLVDIKYAWDVVKGKLVDSLNTIELEGNLGNRLNDFDQQRVKQPLSLYAIGRGPRLRLLWAAIQQLEKEVNNIAGGLGTVDMLRWFPVSYEIIQKSCQSVCKNWLEKELSIKNNKADKELLGLIVQKLIGDETILQNIQKSGKEDLYAELMFFLRFGSLRQGHTYDNSLFILHGVAILEDLLITLADGIVGIYLELISVDGNMSNEMNSQGLSLCSLSTRELQRLRNEVLLNQWLHQNLEAVVSMYEDRFDLCTFQSQLIQESSNTEATKFSLWKRFSLKKSQPVLPPLSYVVVCDFCMPVKRTRELRALKGWRYYYSLFLELSDITMPLLRAVFQKISDAVSFLLVCLIGRSLGLIYSGIRQSLRWK